MQKLRDGLTETVLYGNELTWHPCTAMAENAEDRERVLQSLNFQSFRRLLFGLLKLGNLCNAIKSKSFIDADSDYECIMYGDFPLAINFSLIFEPGILFLKDVIGRRVEGKMDYEKRALQKLEDYVKEMGKYYNDCFLRYLGLVGCNSVNHRCYRTNPLPPPPPPQVSTPPAFFFKMFV